MATSQNVINANTVTPLRVIDGGTGISSFGTGVASALGNNVTGSSGIALSNSPTFITPTLGAANATSLNFGSSSTTGIIGGITGSTISAGVVGELISSIITNVSATPISSGVTTNITSITLTAGNWDLWGNIGINGTTVGTTVSAITTASASFPVEELRSYITPGSLGITVAMPVPSFTYNSGTGITFYLIVNSIGTGSMTMYGGIYARRRA